jgi:hypothetical protein
VRRLRLERREEVALPHRIARVHDHGERGMLGGGHDLHDAGGVFGEHVACRAAHVIVAADDEIAPDE